MWFSTSSFMLSVVMKIAGNSNNYPWGSLGSGGLFVKITCMGKGLFGAGGIIDNLRY